MVPRLCILGYGKVARELHRFAWAPLAAQSRVEVAVVCEPSAEGAWLAGEHFPGARVVRGEASDVLSDPDFEIADICTPGHTHAALALQALAASLHVMLEKPPCHTSGELESIIAAAAGAGRAVTVCQSFRFQMPCRRVFQAIEQGQLGEVTRVHVTHHARHALSESEWVTKVRPDGMMFENALHFVDMVATILGLDAPLRIDAVKFYETAHRRVLTGFELLASDGRGRNATIDFLQDSLVHSALQSRALVSGTGADAELRFSPPGFRLLSGVVDPLSDLTGEARRLARLASTMVAPARRAQPHAILAADLLDAIATSRPTIAPPESLRPTIPLLEELARLWAAHAPEAGPTPTTSFTVPPP